MAPHIKQESPSSSPENARQKLTGRAFYESLGSPKMVLAPMVDQSEFAWRMLTRSFMSPEESKTLLAYTPMIHSRMFKETVKFRDHHLQPSRTGLATPPKCTSTGSIHDPFLDGHPAMDRPLFVQFCANSPDELLEAARYVEPFCDAVDLNLGCPQSIARRGNYGAFLQEDWGLIYRLINKLHRNLNVPVTAKMRILESKEKTLKYAQTILSAGASIITVHGRQRDQKGHKTGLADWSVLRYLRANLPPDTVIFANGNILHHKDIDRCLEETGADGVMSAEGNLCDPTIFANPPNPGAEGREYWRGRSGKGGYRMDAVFRRYMDILYQHVLEKPIPKREPLFLPSDPPDEKPKENLEIAGTDEVVDAQPPAKRQKRSKKDQRPTSPNLLAMQPHLFHLLRFLVAKHTDIRDALARSRAGDMLAFENVLSMVEEAVRRGLLEYEADPAKFEEPEILLGGTQDAETGHNLSSMAAVRACKRPWWICQPYVRPLPQEALEKGSLTMSKKDRRKLEEQKVIERAKAERTDVSVRERLDQEAGLERSEMPKEAMVSG
ncbi:tRNA dihydrouridine synthase [Lecanora helva]